MACWLGFGFWILKPGHIQAMKFGLAWPGLAFGLKPSHAHVQPQNHCRWDTHLSCALCMRDWRWWQWSVRIPRAAMNQYIQEDWEEIANEYGRVEFKISKIGNVIIRDEVRSGYLCVRYIYVKSNTPPQYEMRPSPPTILEKLSWRSGFISPSASIRWFGQWMILKVPSSMCSQMKWCWMSMCLACYW